MSINSDISGATILIVDDEKANVEFLEVMLRTKGFHRIISTTDSRAASGLYRRHYPDIVLLDLSMPHLDGFQVMAQMKNFEHDEFLPVLVLTGNLDRETRLKALSSGAKDFVSKPFDSGEVLMRIRNIVETRLLQRELKNQNAILEKKVRDRTSELRDTQLEVVRRLVSAVERRQAETGVHVVRMSLYCVRLGRAVGLSEQECDDLLHASPMHDVGKIGIPDSILLKPGPLTSEEWTVMRTHSQIGAEILSGATSPLLQLAHTIALTHHEKWDGSGYPSGLAGEAIPLVGRICAISDVFDAVTSNRCYHQAWTVEQAAELIRSEGGSHFDPRLVEAFNQVLPEWIDIKNGVASIGR